MSPTAIVSVEDLRGRHMVVISLCFDCGAAASAGYIRAALKLLRESDFGDAHTTVQAGSIRLYVGKAHTARARAFLERVGREVLALK